MDFYFMYVMPPLLGIAIGAVIGAICGMGVRKGSGARLAALVEDRVAELRLANGELLETNRQLAEETVTDVLTGALNRRFLTTHLPREAMRIQRLRESRGAVTPGNALLVVDVDDFKAFNDRHGHVCGDQALVRFAEILKGAVRDSDYVVRWGGDEFVLLATDAAAEDGEIIAERILAAVREHAVFDMAGAEKPVTCSIGVSHLPFFPDHARALDWQQVLTVADLCAYTAKHNGKDGWVSLRGRHYDPGFRYGTLLDDLSSAPDELFLDKTLIMTRSAVTSEDPTIPSAVTSTA